MNKNLPDHIVGAIYVVISALMYATMPILAKLAYATGLEPGFVLWLRYVFAFILLAVFLTCTRSSAILLFSPLAILQGVFMIGSGLFYFYSLQYLPAGLASIIFFSHPVLVALLALVVFKEKFNPRLFLGILLTIGGIILISVPGSTHQISLSFTGLGYCILACVCCTGYALIGQKNVTSASPLSLVSTFALIGILLIPCVSGRSPGFLVPLTGVQLLITISMALFNTVLSIFFFLQGVKKIGAATASLISSLEPVLTVIIAFLVLSETMAPLQLLGSAMVLASMFLALRPQTIPDSASAKLPQ